jgi:hypothetical protein
MQCNQPTNHAGNQPAGCHASVCVSPHRIASRRIASPRRKGRKKKRKRNEPKRGATRRETGLPGLTLRHPPSSRPLVLVHQNSHNRLWSPAWSSCSRAGHWASGQTRRMASQMWLFSLGSVSNLSPFSMFFVAYHILREGFHPGQDTQTRDRERHTQHAKSPSRP